ncbi:MAG: LPS export ABC transporter permease LptF [Pseudomonadota bacterium]
MSVAARYLNRELIAVFLVTLAMLLLVAVGGRFLGYLQEAAMGKFTGSTVLTIMALRMPEFIQLVAPFSIYVAIVLTLGRFYADQEMVVLQGAGTSTARLVKWLSTTLVGVTLSVGALAWVLTPIAQQQLAEFMVIQRTQTEFETVNPGTFHIYDRGKRVTYSEDMSDDQRTIFDVFMSQRLDDGRQVTLWANEGYQQTDPATGSHFLVLKQGRRYEGLPGDADFRIMSFAELRQRLTVARRPDADQEEGKPIWDLRLQGKEGAEFHWRIALPLFCLIGGLLGVGISKVKPRQGRFARVVPGMLVMLIYYLALLINRNAIAEDQIPTWMGMWLIHLIFALFAAKLLHNLGRPVKA